MIRIAKRKNTWLILGVVLAVGSFGTLLWAAGEGDKAKKAPAQVRSAKATPEELELGKKVYFKRCVWCHGPEGAGDGPGADRLWPRPRNFNQGTFKIRHTESGELPTDQDMFLTVTHGLPGSAMPPWKGILSDKERMAVVKFVQKELVKDRSFEDPDEDFDVIDFGKQVASSKESIEKGREVFMKKGKCVECHGELGKGDGNATQKDEWGFPIMPANLTKCWNFRGNRADPYNPANVFREVSTGLNGTPMPSFVDILSIEERWNVANFVISLCPKMAIDPLTDKPKLRFVVKSTFTEEELPASIEDQKWKDAEPTYVGLGSQIIHKPRNFVRQVDDVWVRSLYNKKEITFLFEWDDRNKSLGKPDTVAAAAAVQEIPPAGQPIAYRGVTEWPVTNDAIAIQFPAKWRELSPPEKPRFVWGDAKHAIDLWKWESAGEVKEYTGKGVKDLNPRSSQNVKVVQTKFQDGRWHVILKRALTTSDKENDVQFEKGYYIPTAFFAWDGNNGDIGPKMSISTWDYLILEPPVPAKVYVYPPIALLVVAGVEFWVWRRFRGGKPRGR